MRLTSADGLIAEELTGDITLGPTGAYLHPESFDWSFSFEKLRDARVTEPNVILGPVVGMRVSVRPSPLGFENATIDSESYPDPKVTLGTVTWR
jgi:hypothetical protein